MAKKPYEEGSILDFAVRGFSKIQKLSKSSLISEKLSAINMLLYLLILGIIISYFLGGYSADMLMLLIFLAFSLLLSCISLLLYAPVLEVVVNISRNKIEGLRVSILILFIDLSIALVGLLFSNELLIKIAGGILGIQLFLIIVFSFISLTNVAIEDKKVKPSKIWDSLGKIAIITGIASFIFDIILILLKI